jgi:HK97 family phage portal protein
VGALNSVAAAAWHAGRALASLVNARARSSEIVEPAPRVVYMPVLSEAGVRMSLDEALRLPVVWACLSVIADSLAASTWDVYEVAENGNRRSRPDARAYRLLNVRPNPEQTAFSFRQSATMCAVLLGDAFAEIERTTRGEPVALWPLARERCELVRDAMGMLRLRVHNYTAAPVDLYYRDVLHFKGPSFDGITGLPLLSYAARTLGHAAALEIFGATLFSNGVLASGVLTPDQPLTKEQADAITAGLRERHQGGPHKGHQLLLLRGGLKFQQLTIAPENAQFIESRKLIIEEIARIFRVPPHMIGSLDRATFNNIEELGISFVRDSLTPRAEPMAQEADAKLLPFGNRLLQTRIDLEWLQEGNAQTQAQADATLVTHGLRTINELRRKRGVNTVGPEGDVLRTQVQYAPLTMPGDGPPTPPGPGRRTEPEPGEAEENEAAGAGVEE